MKQIQSKIIFDLDKLVSIVNHYKDSGYKIVTANGAFDLIHAGHLNFILKSKEQGQMLIVSVNTDEYIRDVKGKEPIVSLIDRCLMVAALEAVDFVTAQERGNPSYIIEAIKPHVHCIGSNFAPNPPELPSINKVGAIACYIDRMGQSTTDIVNKIKGGNKNNDT